MAEGANHAAPPSKSLAKYGTWRSEGKQVGGVVTNSVATCGDACYRPSGVRTPDQLSRICS
jgi:hypothetical protein